MTHVERDPRPHDRPDRPLAARLLGDWSVRPARWAGATALAAAATVGLGAAGVAAVTAEPEHRVQFRIPEGLPHGITQERVEAAAERLDVRSWSPLTVAVTDEHLLPPADYGRSGPEADVLISTQLSRSVGDVQDRRREVGVTVDPAAFPVGGDLPRGHAPFGREPSPAEVLSIAYETNRDAGNGPSAVAVTARTAAALADPGAEPDLGAWVGRVAVPGVLTVLGGVMTARALRARAELRRMHRTARTDMSHVVLELEALEVSALSVPEEHRTQRMRAQWDEVRAGAVALARREGLIAEETARPGADTEERVRAYARDAARVRAQAEALEAASLVQGAVAGGGEVLDEVAAALVEPARRAVAAVRGAQGRPPESLEAAADLQDAVDDLLTRLQAFRQDPEALDAQAWTAAEQRIGACADALTAAAANADEGRVGSAAVPYLQAVERAASVRGLLDGWPGLPAPAQPADLRATREGLGLDALPAGGALDAVDRAVAAARVSVGEHPEDVLASVARDRGVDSADPAAPAHPTSLASPAAPTVGEQAPSTSVSTSASPSASGTGRGGPLAWAFTEDRHGRFRLTAPARVGGALLALLVSFGLGTAAADQLERDPAGLLPGRQDPGDVSVHGLPLDGHSELELDRDHVSRLAGAELAEGLDVVVAVRDAETVLRRDPERQATDEAVPVTQESVLQLLEDIKADLPEDVVDPATGDVLPGVAVVPVVVYPDGRGGALEPMTGPVATGTTPQTDPGADAADSTSVPLRDLTDPAQFATVVGAEVRAAGTQSHARAEDAVDPAEASTTRTVVTVAGTVLLVGLGAITETLAGVSAGRRGRGRTADSLRRSRSTLERLLLEEDRSALDAVAVLGTGPAGSPEEAAHRLYSSALLAAWDELEELEGQSWSSRLADRLLDRAESLEQRVQELARQDEDVRRRAERFLAESR
ncbi:hypothetical protein M3C74_06940 [Micrococcus lylae]|uniref:hypothetical protein n=1 Tax=Micrococcus lylae TaxID=1273 RepID=UPI0021A746E5|nr:hypothetical protein [Micrococcus lylae]MCT2006410.1 hypothetical protein [Micrococcus lylae]MCT2071567.1 hypothetical protein [Micrococcus lylae]